MIDKELHKNTQYRIEGLRKQIKEAQDRVGSFVIDCNEPNWDGYDAYPISVETIKKTSDVLGLVYEWFKDNIGFLNNRSFEIDSSPSCCGGIHIEIFYDCYRLDIEVKDKVLLIFQPKYRYKLEGKYTIADREVSLWHSDDKMVRTVKKDKEIIKFLDEAFYKHKWSFK